MAAPQVVVGVSDSRRFSPGVQGSWLGVNTPSFRPGSSSLRRILKEAVYQHICRAWSYIGVLNDTKSTKAILLTRKWRVTTQSENILPSLSIKSVANKVPYFPFHVMKHFHEIKKTDKCRAFTFLSSCTYNRSNCICWIDTLFCYDWLFPTKSQMNCI